MINFRLPPFVRLLLFGGLLGLDSCNTDSAPDPPVQWPTYRPVYASHQEVRKVEALPPQPIRRPGKIYIKDRYLYINEIGRGIHIVDNADPAKPVRLGFLAIPGNQELAIKGDILYADNTLDLIAISLADPRNIRVVKRIENAFPYPSYPTERNVRFECADPNKGIVVRWEPATVPNPRCFR